MRDVGILRCSAISLVVWVLLWLLTDLSRPWLIIGGGILALLAADALWLAYRVRKMSAATTSTDAEIRAARVAWKRDRRSHPSGGITFPQAAPSFRHSEHHSS
jgi:hypothetical protein